MGFFAWLRRWRLDRLRTQLAMVDAEIASDADVARRTGAVYPIAQGLNARERARIVETMRQIQQRADER